MNETHMPLYGEGNGGVGIGVDVPVLKTMESLGLQTWESGLSEVRVYSGSVVLEFRTEEARDRAWEQLSRPSFGHRLRYATPTAFSADWE